MRRTRLTGLAAALMAGGLVLAACGDDDNGVAEPADEVEEPEAEEPEAEEPEAEEPEEEEPEAAEEDWGTCDPREGAAPVPDPEGTGEDETSLTVGIFEGWDESYASAYLFQAVLEDQGYDIEFTELEAGVTYAGTASGDIDFFTDGWLPVTHPHYVEEYGEDIESLGCWYDNARLTIAVNEDAPIDSLDELNDAAGEFGGTLYGIEPGAGLTSITEEEVIPTYGLDDIEFAISSTPAMLAQLQSSTGAGENVAVTLWHPHWAYDAFPIKDLEDPEGALGDVEFIYNFGRSGFSSDNPNVAQLVQNFVMSSEELAELENLMFSEEHYAGEDHEAAVADWIADNEQFVDDLKAGEL